jgi:hypothetical protein
MYFKVLTLKSLCLLLKCRSEHIFKNLCSIFHKLFSLENDREMLRVFQNTYFHVFNH